MVTSVLEECTASINPEDEGDNMPLRCLLNICKTKNLKIKGYMG
jgi:hypothetical protein